jgi:hypothetical protein
MSQTPPPEPSEIAMAIAKLCAENERLGMSLEGIARLVDAELEKCPDYDPYRSGFYGE